MPYFFGNMGNMLSIWYNHFGFAENAHGQRAVVLGEWGGFYGRGPSGDRDRVWHDALVDWLLANCLEDSFYWGINPNVGLGGWGARHGAEREGHWLTPPAPLPTKQSGDTGGLLEDDWATPVQPKLNLLARLQPRPSFLYWAGTPDEGPRVCLVEGAYANPRCEG